MDTIYEQNIVLDIEFTPTSKEGRQRGIANETIEIGAVRVSPTGDTQDSFSQYIRPAFTRKISPRIEKLTGVSYSMVKDCGTLPAALNELSEWIGEASTRIVSWSKTDSRQLEKEAEAHGLTLPLNKYHWLDLQKVYPRFLGIESNCLMALRKALNWCGMKPSPEKLHGALYDAEMTSKLLSQILTGDYMEHRKILSKTIRQPSTTNRLSSSIGSKFEALLSSLEFQPC